MKTATVEDVARAAGVSTATVSRVLNGTGAVSPKTAARVRAAVEDLGYTPNFNARALAARRTFTIGAIIPTMENAMFARGLQAFQEGLRDAGYTLLVASTGYDADVEAEQIRTLVARGADGLMLIGYDRPQASYDYLIRREVPFVVTWAYRPDHPYVAVGFDNRAAMAQMAQAVLDKGHRHIGMIAGITTGNDRAAERLRAVRDVMAANGLNPDSLNLCETPYSIEEGGAAFAELMAHPTPPTAVICGSDVIAVGAMARAQEMGLRVPFDVSITGFDDIELGQAVRPQLTTIHVPHDQMGQRAARTLIAMVEGQAGRSETLEAPILLRDSLSRPR